MNPPRAIIGAVLAGAAAVLALSGCGAIADEAVDRITDQAGVDIDRDGGQVRVTTDDGTLTMDGEGGTFELTTPDGQVSSQTGKLPDGFPDAVPLVDGEIIVGTSSTIDGATTFTVQVKPDGSDPAGTFDRALAKLTGAGFREGDATSRTEGGDGSVFATAQLGDGTYDVVLGTVGAPDDHFVTYHVSSST